MNEPTTQQLVDHLRDARQSAMATGWHDVWLARFEAAATRLSEQEEAIAAKDGALEQITQLATEGAPLHKIGPGYFEEIEEVAKAALAHGPKSELGERVAELESELKMVREANGAIAAAEARAEKAEAALASAKRDGERLLNVARGCFDYGGGYRSDAGKLEIFHHGIQTVVNALEGAMRDPSDTQARALERIGIAARAQSSAGMGGGQ